ncbi:MAG TPA: CHASE2 domain-containing protein [Pyrinomonadaceae bacterium]|nr:CHASE2 domain-containing protein [Pyrinomonadaceae bacterium]
MAGKKQKKVTRREAAKVDVAPVAEKPSAPVEKIKWRWRPLLGSLLVLSLLILFLSFIKFFDLLNVDRYLQDLLISYAGRSEARVFDSRVTLLMVDEATQPNQPFGAANPSHRKYHAEMVRALTKAGAKVIVFDVLFRTTSDEVDPDFAQAIVEAEKAGTRIVIGAFLPIKTFEPQISAPLKAAVGEHWGIVDGATSKSGDARFIRLAADKSNEPFNGLDEQPVIPSLALQAVRLLNYPSVPTSVWFSPLASQVRIRSGDAGGPLLASIPVNREMELLVDLFGKDEITHYSYQEVLSHVADYAGNFKDKLVVIGYQKDDKLPSSSSEKEPRYAVEIHATAMSTLLTGSYIKPLPVVYHFLFIVVLVAIAAFLQIRFSKWMDRTQTIPLPFLPAPFNSITIPIPIFVVALVYLLFAVLAFQLAYIVFDMSYHLAALILTYSVFVVGRSKFVR